ncbi:ATP-binding SpoIIE family protein phosphatase [uncultured Chitinophaga sp.]|jgi:Anti-sigma regulatory factor (Ser/Thr protein kinase)|uniref:ATP-binding SpoIIE family protein phosphatase n=1 Tax=uncultured Chitinophaga sp. TaxID=339340 RepID=UPI00261E92F0|nr:ATP-binding SpoIIE family protein phosphatase [uncultured Chitinophaga sp.]
MVSRTSISIKAAERSYLASLKREIHSLASSARFGDRKIGEIDIVVAEIGTNLVNHGGGGEVLVKLIEEDGHQGIEILALDKGPGMADVSRMMVDGVSTKSTLGQGLGAIKRLSDYFQVYSQPGWGTVVLSRIFNEPLPSFRKKPAFEISTLLVPKPNERYCGDGYYAYFDQERLIVFLGDGLGHGVHAEAAVTAAIESLKACNSNDSVTMLRHIHESVRKTRGLVATIAILDIRSRMWNFCGIGNIHSRLVSHSNHYGYMPYNGIIGMNIPNSLKEREFPYEPGQYLLFCSDGIKSRIDLNRHTSIQRFDPSIIAAAVYNEFARHTDDTGIVVCKINL